MQNSSVVRKHATPEQRVKILEAWRSSPLPDKAFASQVGLGVSTLHAWRRRVASRPPDRPCAFVAVPNLLAAEPAVAAYRLHWPSGLSLEVRSGFAAAELAALLQLLPAL
jgi:hypothetical protein